MRRYSQSGHGAQPVTAIYTFWRRDGLLQCGRMEWNLCFDVHREAVAGILSTTESFKLFKPICL